MAPSLEELVGHGGMHFSGNQTEEESSDLGEVPVEASNDLGEVDLPPQPRGALGTFLSSAASEVTQPLPLRNFFDIARGYRALSQARQGDYQGIRDIAAEHNRQALSEQTHPLAAKLGQFLGSLPALGVAGEMVKPLESLPWMARLAHAGRVGKGIAEATKLGGQFGAMEAIQGHPQAIPSGAAQGVMLGGFLGAAQPTSTLSGRTAEEAKGALEAKRQELITQADLEVRKYRRPTETVSGGQLALPAKEALAREAKFAWEPARTLAKSIPEPITYTELDEASRRRFASPEDEPRRQNAMRLFQRAYEVGRGQRATVYADAKTADELVELSSQLGGKIPQTIRGRKMPAKVSTLDEIDSRSILADVFHDKAPAHLKNALQDAKERWQDYAVGFRYPMHRYLQVGASAAQETQPGIDLFTRVAHRQETPTERRFLQKLEQEIGVKIFEPLRQAGEGLAHAERQVAKAQAAQQFARYLARAAVVSPLLYLFTRRPIYQALRSR